MAASGEFRTRVVQAFKSISSKRIFLSHKSICNACIHFSNCRRSSKFSQFPQVSFVRKYYIGSPSALCNPVRRVLDDSWKEVKEKFLNMGPDEKRAFNSIKGGYVSIDSIHPWPTYFDKLSAEIPVNSGERKYSVNFAINNRVSVRQGNIINMGLDAIVNSAAKDLLGGGGAVDKAIHEAAGKELKLECMTFHGCDIGEAKLTGAYRLPAKYIIHTTGPKGVAPAKLKACYKSCLMLMKRHRLGTIAFPCISTGSSGYPPEEAAHLALETVRKFLTAHPDKPHRVCFIIHLPEDLIVYHQLMQIYFPLK